MNELNSRFLEAVSTKKGIDEISSFFTMNVEVNVKNPRRKTALMIACEEGNVALVELLLKQRGIDVNLDDEEPNHFTALLYAVNADKEGSHRRIVDALFSHGTLSQDSYQIALAYYAKIGDLEKVKECITVKNCLPNMHRKFADSALINATENGHETVVRYLLSIEGIDLNIRNYLKETPIIIAARNGYINLANLFLETGKVDLHVHSYLLDTPLVAAIYYEREELAKALISREEKLDGKIHCRVLLCAVENDMADLTDLLITKGIDVNSTGKEEYKKPPEWVWDEPHPSPFAYSGPPTFELPIIVALRDNKINVLPILIKHQADMNKIGAGGRSAKQLVEATGNISEEAKKIVMRPSLELHKKSNVGSTQSLFFSPSPDSDTSSSKQSSTIEKNFSLHLDQVKQYLDWLKIQPECIIASEVERLKELFQQIGLTLKIEIKPKDYPSSQH